MIKNRVPVNRDSLEYKEITSGMFQGSALGHIFFVLYTNNLSTCLEHGSKLFMCADETEVFQ